MLSAWCSGLTSVYNYCVQPVTIDDNVFSYVDYSAFTLYVLAESLDLYKAADVWKNFLFIESIKNINTGVEVISVGDGKAPQKVVIDGHFYILMPNGSMFDANGKKIE